MTTPTEPIPKDTTARPARRKLRKVLKVTAIAAVSAVAIILLLITSAVLVLSPSRLTPLVCRYASQYLTADVSASRIELSFWSTFPHLTVEVDSLHVRSRSLLDIPDSVARRLPVGADSLLAVKSFHGGVNVPRLAIGQIALYDVAFTDIRANLIQADSLHSNFDILPPAPPEEAPDTAPLGIPDISINSFTIASGMNVRYRALSDSVDAAISLHTLDLAADSASHPVYALALDAGAKAILPDIDIPSTPFSIDGDIHWEAARPLDIELNRFTLTVGNVPLRFSAKVSAADTLCVPSFRADIPRTPLSHFTELLPQEQKKLLDGLHTDLTVEASAHLLSPFRSGAPLPKAEATLKIDASTLTYERLALSALNLDVTAITDLADPDLTEINLTRLAAKGTAVDFALSGTATHPLTDPLIDARFTGNVALQRLPSSLLSLLPCTLRGEIHGDADIHTRLSYLNPKSFHHARIDGNLSLSDFRMAMTDGSMESFIRSARFRFGTSSVIKASDRLVDSMLTLSTDIDTLWFYTPGMEITASKLAGGAGAKNDFSSPDTTVITPIGANFTAARLTLNSTDAADTMRLRLREVHIGGGLTRYQGKGRSPLIQATVEAGSLRYADCFNRAFIRSAHADLNIHPKAPPAVPTRLVQAFDSLAAAHPDLSTDSIKSMMRTGIRNYYSALDSSRSGRENIKVDIDHSFHRMLRRWNLQGSLRAKRVRLFTPYFPSRNSLTDLNMSFSTDSVTLRRTKLKVDDSDFTLNGSVRNISRALTSRRGQCFEIDFGVESDTINVNSLTATMLRGAVFAKKIEDGSLRSLSRSAADDIDDLAAESIYASMDTQVPDTAMSPVIVPSNVRAAFSMKAKHILYTDLWLRGLDGLVEMYDGAINIDRLRATTNVGAMNFSALYSAPTATDISIAAALRIRRLNLRSVLDMLPGIDSVLPLLGEIRGIVDADMALTSRLDPHMDLIIPSVNLALKISGDSLQLMDNDTFRTLAKWMMFKRKERNLIDHMDVELTVHDGYIDLYPFIFDMDRYRIGVRGSNDAALNLNYHVAVIKSPIPFKFGINIKGTPEKMKIRLGKARINDATVAESRQVTDHARVNLINEITRVFRRGVRASGSAGLRLDTPPPGQGKISDTEPDENFTHADSVVLIQNGLIDRPAGFLMPGEEPPAPAPAPEPVSQRKKSRKK